MPYGITTYGTAPLELRAEDYVSPLSHKYDELPCADFPLTFDLRSRINPIRPVEQ